MSTTNIDLVLQDGGGCNFFQWIDDVPATSVAKSTTRESKSNDCKLCKIRESENIFLRRILCIIIVSLVLIYWEEVRKS